MRSDSEVQHDVLAELEWEPSLDAAQIGVAAKQGVVTLTGHVAHLAEKLTAEEVARRVHGVRGVANDVEVRLGESHRRDDSELAAAAVQALEWHPKVPHDWIQVIVRDGWVTLTGNVDRQYQKSAAGQAVHHLLGARGITNSIVVQPRDAPRVTKSSIEAALQRHATLHRRKIRVETEDRAVKLIGDVHSHAEQQEAERIAWGARGVAAVDNCLTVTPWGTGPAEEWGY